MDETIIFFGDTIKALGNGRIGGFLVKFADASSPDLDGEFFTKNTEFFIDDGASLPVLYDHGCDPLLKRRKLGSATVTMKEAGLWLETQLSLRDDYEKAVYKLVEMGKAGWSSGVAGHMAARRRVKNAVEITEWGIAEASVTYRPADYTNQAVALKSFQPTPLSDFLLKKIDETENEYRYRLHDPKDFEQDSFRTVAIKKDKPHVNGIVGKLNGETSTTLQAYRFPKDEWDKADAEKWAVEHKIGKKSVAPDMTLADKLNQHIDDRVDDGHTRDAIIKSLAKESGLQVETVNLILDDSFKPNDANLKAFARVLNIDYDMLKSATRRDYAKTIKGMFEEALTEQIPSRWQLDSVYADIVRKIAHTAQASAVTGVDFDYQAKIKEATGEYLTRLQELAVNQVSDYIESKGDEPFYLKAIINPTEDLLVSGSLDLEQHSQLAVSVSRDVVKRFWLNHENRKREATNQKVGRVLSQANRNRLSSFKEQMIALMGEVDKLLEESQPMASEEKMRAARTRHLALRHERRLQLGA